MTTPATHAAPLHAAVDGRQPLLRVRDLAVSFAPARPGAKRVQAVDGVSMTIYPGQTLAVVGESGCGKSVTAMSMLQLIPKPPAHVDRGEIRFASDAGDCDLLTLPDSAIRRIRGGEIAMIFQEPMTSLNPVFTIGDQITEAILLHQPVTRKDARDIAIQAMTDVGITKPAERLNAYPHQFSGGMRQRVMIAMALACEPKLLLADEPTTALDVTIQAQILDLLRSLQQRRHMAVMLITHALGVVAEQADVVCVMYAGRVVEYARVLDLFDRPLHPYTRGLLASIPRTQSHSARLTTIREVIDDPAEFCKLGEGLRPWWPWQPPPHAAVSHLHEVEPEHWVSLWETPTLAAASTRPPDLDYRLQR